MFSQRTAVAAILTPLALIVIYFGGWVYQLTIVLLLVVAAWEYTKLLQITNLQPSLPLVLGGVALLGLSRSLVQFNYSSALLTLLLFALAACHILRFERGDPQPATNFGASLSVLLYVGFLGSYLISLRALPEGRWWTYLVLPVVWIADTGAYLIGTWIGKLKLAPKTSPNKTWEGYLAGILSGILGGIGLFLLYRSAFGVDLGISPLQAGLLSLVVSALIPLGDLTESMVKRQAGQKDSGTLFPGHGGVFDRIDSLFWAAPIAYYLIYHCFL
jgi:phosphatidate cytidylyltransferase